MDQSAESTLTRTYRENFHPSGKPIRMGTKAHASQGIKDQARIEGDRAAAGNNFSLSFLSY
jgi:hypothetical protein